MSSRISSHIKRYWDEEPLKIIFLFAILFRLIAVIFSKGYGMSDDHFVIIEKAQQWVSNSLNWFSDEHTDIVNLFYVGFHYYLFSFFDKILGITDPQIKMFWIRLIHALYSLLVVWYGYKITLELSNKKNAKLVGLLLAILWPLPFLSVRNLVEVVSIPPILMGLYYLLDNNSKKLIYISGILLGIAFIIRFQSALIIFGIGLVLLFNKDWGKFLFFNIGLFITVLFSMGVVDWIVYGIPFHTFLNYFTYNIEHQFDYIIQPWYNYIILILGMLIPPISIFISVGFFSTIKKYALLFWPTFIFILFHSYFANKQERFIIPVVPLIIMLGIMGWNEFVAKSEFWKSRQKWLRYSWIWFWSINTIFLIVFTFTYGKKNRVESLYYLSQKDHISSIIWDSGMDGAILPPLFYLETGTPTFTSYERTSFEILKKEIEENTIFFPEYLVTLGDVEIKQRVSLFENTFNKKLVFENKVEPSLVDAILHKLNPKHNKNQTSYIYRIETSKSLMRKE